MSATALHTGRRLVLAGDLALLPASPRRAAVAVLASIAAVTAGIVLLDAVVFRRQLDPGYVSFFTSPLLPRMPVLCVFAAWEEVKFRLLAMTALVALARLVRRDPPAVYVAIILLAQFANVGALVMADPLYAALRYWAVGAVWGWLYWRHG